MGQLGRLEGGMYTNVEEHKDHRFDMSHSASSRLIRHGSPCPWGQVRFNAMPNTLAVCETTFC